MNWIFIGIVSFLTGMAASLGLGGGFILLIYLTIFADMPQLAAQGVNLIFFIPIAALSLVIHAKNGLIEKKPLLPAILIGILVVIAGAFLAKWIGSKWLSKLFGAFILVIGVKELFHKKPAKSSDSSLQEDTAAKSS